MNAMIRRAAPQDAPEISHVHVLAWQSAYRGIVPQPLLDSLELESRTEMWRTRLDRREGNIYVAETQDRLNGFISGGKLREPITDAIGEFDAELYAIYLLPSATRQGIGKLLTRCLAEVLAAQGLRTMAVWVLADNPSRRFYEHLGAQQVGKKWTSIGGKDLLEVAYHWPELRTLTMPV